jgi:alpha/beta superfamily hydrolase
MIGFVIYLMHSLIRPHTAYRDDPFMDINHLSPVPSQALPPPRTQKSADDQNLTPEDWPILSKKLRSKPEESLLLIAGYSYGSLITTQLPNLPAILDLFKQPIIGSAASEIRLRAQQLAKQQNDVFIRLAARPISKSDTEVNELHQSHFRGRSLDLMNSRHVSATSGVRMGGEETDATVRRASHDSHRHSLAFETPERVRKSIDRVRSLGGRPGSRAPALRLPRRQTSSPEKRDSSRSVRSSSSIDIPKPEGEKKDDAKYMPVVKLSPIRPAYLLVSPLQGLVRNLAMWSLSSNAGEINPESKLTTHHTLAVFGDRDGFTSNKRIRAWAKELSAVKESKFIYAEVSGGGHFWIEEGVMGKVRSAVEEFVKGL